VIFQAYIGIKKLANFLKISDFWQYLPNLAPSGNPGVNTKWNFTSTNRRVRRSCRHRCL